MIKIIKEGFNSDSGYITAFDVNIGKITREVNDAIQEAVSYIDSGNAYPTWYWEIGHDDEKMWCLVLGFMDGYEPNEDEFTDSYGSHLALKWGAISNRSAMYEFDMDFEMPYDEETGDVWDSCTAIESFDASSDVKYEIEDFYEFVKQYNASLGDDFDESFSKRKPSDRRSVRESRKPMSKRIVKEGVKDVLDNIQAYCDSLNSKYNPSAGDFGIVDCGNGTYQIGIYSKADGRLFGTYSQAMKPRDLVFFIKNVLDIMHVCE